MFFVAGGDFRWQAVFEAIFEGVNMVGAGNILSPPDPPPRRGWEVLPYGGGG